jgi:hypothetical protein
VTGLLAGWAIPGRRPSWAGVAALAFATYYVAAWATGMRFTTWYVDEGWQVLPRDPLVSDPLSSLWYLHIQPPVWNATVAAVLRLSPVPDALSLQLLMASLGIAAVWLAADLLWRVTARPVVTVGIALLAVLNPAVFSNVLEPRYELAVTTLLLACAWLPVRLAHRPFLAFALVIWAGAVLVMTRALYHPVWLVVLIVGAWWFIARHEPWRRAAVHAIAPVAVVGLWMLKNLVVFGTFALSSWTGMNMLRSVEPMVDQATLSTLWRSGEISSVGYVGPFASLDEYERFGTACEPSRDHPVLTIRVREDRPVPVSNFNHECYLDIFSQAGHDAWKLIREEPGAWLRGRWEGTLAYASQPDVAAGDGSPIVRATRAVFRVVDVQVPGTIPVRLLSRGNEVIEVKTHYSVVATASTVAAIGLAGALAARRVRGRLSSPPGFVMAVAVVGVTTAWTALAGIVGELGEQARFRGAIQTCTLVVCAAAAARWRTGRAPDAVLEPR